MMTSNYFLAIYCMFADKKSAKIVHLIRKFT